MTTTIAILLGAALGFSIAVAIGFWLNREARADAQRVKDLRETD